MRIQGKQTQPSLQSEAVTFVKLEKQEQYQRKQIKYFYLSFEDHKSTEVIQFFDFFSCLILFS